MAEFREREHPRGQPDNAGQFVKNGEAQGGSAQSKEYSNLPSAGQLVERYERKFGTVDREQLTPSEWRRYYDAIGDIKAETVRERKTKNGNRWVILNSDELPDGTRTPARLIIDNGKYISPKVKTILTFDNDDEMYDLMDRLGR
ncbi:MAG: hypothetical protein K2M89_06320 [Clostridiales bacterium]|nr:hypothetical protein [Clostridiales bacterium]